MRGPSLKARSSHRWERLRLGFPERREIVTSRDGTRIGFRAFGSGPALVLVHGGLMASQNFVRLGLALAEAFTVIIPDRRGRGMSGPHGDAYCVARESEDVRALVEKTGARYVFGLSSGAIVAISAALAIPDIEKVAAYEPPYAITPFDPVGWVPRFDREIGEGKLGHALLTVMKGTGDSELLRRAPRFLLAPLLELAVRQSARTVAGGDVPLAELIPTMHYDARIVAEASRTVSELTGLGAEVLLIGGSNSADFLRGVLDALPRFLPHAARIELSSANHTSADNEGDPMAVAAALRRFFEAPRARAIAS